MTRRWLVVPLVVFASGCPWWTEGPEVEQACQEAEDAAEGCFATLEAEDRLPMGTVHTCDIGWVVSCANDQNYGTTLAEYECYVDAVESADCTNDDGCDAAVDAVVACSRLD